LALRLRALTKDEFKDLQTAINTKFFDFMLEWYGNNVDSSVQVDSTNENEKKLFVKEAMVEFIVKVNDQYLGKLFEKVNKKFNLNFMVYQGRNVKT
jgi:DNA-dependent RNA polymerase auxiliary subunit epsilon